MASISASITKNAANTESTAKKSKPVDAEVML